MRITAKIAVWALACLWMSAAAFAQDTVLNRASELLTQQDAQGAYALLKPLEEARAGDPEFDLLLGAAALNSKRLSEAVFALERVLAGNPNHPLARALIARAYFELGETKTAKQEFETAKGLSPPAEAAEAIQRFLDAIERREAGIGTKLTGYLEATIGDDSNVNSATGSSQVAVPAFGGTLVTLNAAGVRAHDSFVSLGGGANLRHNFKPDLAFIAGMDVNKRINGSQDTFDTGFWSGYAGLNYTREKNSFTVAAQGQEFYLDNNRFRDAYGVTGQWQHALDDFNSLSAYVQYSRLDYPTQSVRNADRTVLGVGYARALEGDLKPVIFLGGYVGEERERAAGVPQLGNQLWGLRLGGQLALRSDITLFASGSVEQRDYGGPDPLFTVTRGDTQSDLRLGLNYKFSNLWTATPQISYTRNRSNIVVSDFERTAVFVTLRRDFR